MRAIAAMHGAAWLQLPSRPCDSTRMPRSLGPVGPPPRVTGAEPQSAATRAPARDPQIRTTDLDALERVAPCIAWGDLEADDPRALSETNFLKIFRLAQLLVEYLLHVQVGRRALGGKGGACVFRLSVAAPKPILSGKGLAREDVRAP
jgi:hypothetical protein